VYLYVSDADVLHAEWTSRVWKVGSYGRTTPRTVFGSSSTPTRRHRASRRLAALTEDAWRSDTRAEAPRVVQSWCRTRCADSAIWE
jgi:hypothetical protein